MRHFVFTRSAYGREWPVEKNRRRLAVTAGVTARMMELQTNRDWTWVICVDVNDPLIEERIAVFAAAAPELKVIRWQRPEVLAAAAWDTRPARAHRLEQVAATAYRAPWREQVGPPDDTILMTRLDDDDAFAMTTLERVRDRAASITSRTALMHPVGYRVWRHRFSRVRHDSNAMQTLVTPPGDSATVYDYGHTVVRRYCPVVVVDQEPAWLWCRHRDTISGWKQADRPIGPGLRREFPIDWSVL